MTKRWADVEAAHPDFAARVKARFDSHTHKLLATIRADGAPRVCGTEIKFADGDIWMGSMRARKADDLRRDGRCVLHADLDDKELPNGDAKIGGVAFEDDADKIYDLWGFPRPEPGEDVEETHLFRIEIRDVSITRVEGNEMIIEILNADGFREVRRN